MLFTTQIQPPNTEPLNVYVRCSYDETEVEPTEINLRVLIESEHPEAIQLTYEVPKHRYQFNNASGRIEETIYKLLIEKLEETYGDRWGFTAN